MSKTVIIDSKYVIFDKNSELYVMCWSEHDHIFLTKDLSNIKDYGTINYAIQIFQQMKKTNCTYLRDLDDSELNDVDLEVGTLTISTNFHKIL